MTSIKNIYLVRHGESLANIDHGVYKVTPDHAIELSEAGRNQASEVGKKLSILLPNNILSENLRIWTSPYKRTRQTAQLILNSLNNRYPSQNQIKEHINLCEQQFGLFDGLTDEELKLNFPLEYANYDLAEKHEGKFWARMPLGESRFDVAIRVQQAFDTFYREAKHNKIENIIVICHGVTLRAFVMQWFNLPYEWFENQPNPKNCDIYHIDVDKNEGSYL